MKSAMLCLSFLMCLAACESARSSAPVPSNAAPPAAVEASGDVAIFGGGGPCGNNVCGRGTFCCNRSCGTCAPLGGACTQQICPTTEVAETGTGAAIAGERVEETCADGAEDTLLAAGGSCGGVTCGKGKWCCNASCARCVPIGMQCTQESCN